MNKLIEKLLPLVKNKLAEAEMRQGCTDHTPHAEQLLKEAIPIIREASFKVGVEAVLKWQADHRVIGFVYDTDDGKVEKQNMVDWANQLRTWGVEHDR